MLYKRMITSWMILTLVLAAGGIQPAAADTIVKELSLARNGIFTELTIYTPGRVLCNQLTVAPKNGKPFRVVVDLCGAIHGLGRSNFADIPPGVITGIRTSQYATTPQNVVRVVLDLNRETTYKVTTDDNWVRVSLVDPDGPLFPQWSWRAPANSPVLAVVDKPTPPAQKPVPEPNWAAEQNDDFASVAGQAADNNRRLESSPAPWEDNTPLTVLPPQVSPPANQPLEQPTATYAEARPVEPAAPKPQKTMSPEPVAVPRPAADEAAEEPGANWQDWDWAVDAVPTIEWVPATPQYDLPAGPTWVEEKPNPVNTAVEQPSTVDLNTQMVAAESPGYVSNEDANAGAIVSNETAPVETPATLPQADKWVKTPAVEKQVEEDVPLLVKLRQKFVGLSEDETVTLDPTAESLATAQMQEISEAAIEFSEVDDQAAGRQFDPSELESKIATVDPSALATGTAYANANEQTNKGPAVHQPGKGNKVSADAARAEVVYDRNGRRDPFRGLVEGQRSGLLTATLPRVDALRLVGVLRDYDGAIALFEDMEGYGYILREGDPVRNGYLKTVGEERVVFQVDEYGWVHTVVLGLRHEGDVQGYDYATDNDEQ